MNKGVFKRYYRLTKPGIVYGNDLSAIAGLFLASIHFRVLAPLTFSEGLIGVSLVMASACVYNNVLDKDIDAGMKRTEKRSLVTGEISVPNALVYATALGTVGLALLALTNWLTAGLGLLGMFCYVVLYGWAKRKTVFSTELGSISGAIPPVIGYTAIAGRLDIASGILFILLVLWQMPHFFAIAIYRRSDYSAVNIPILSVKKGVKRTKWEIMIYICLFIAALPLLTLFGYSGYVYLLLMLAVSLYWLWVGVANYRRLEDIQWGRKMFFTSLLVLLVMCAAIPLGALAA